MTLKCWNCSTATERVDEWDEGGVIMQDYECPECGAVIECEFAAEQWNAFIRLQPGGEVSQWREVASWPGFDADEMDAAWKEARL